MGIKIVELKDCVDLIIDYRGKTPGKLGGDWSESGIRVISALNVHNGFIDNEDKIRCVSEDLYKKWMQVEIQRGDCLLASEGASLGENTIRDSDEKIVLGQRLYAIRTKKDILDPWFLAFYMQTKKFKQQIDNVSTGSTVFGISQPILLSLKILLPDIAIQREVGKMYKGIRSKIKLNNKINSELEAMAKELYEYWFVQFDFPDENGKPYKSSGGKMVWNEELKREIPEGWEVKPILDLVSWQGASQPAKENFIYEPKEGYIRFIQNRDYADNSNITYIPEDMSDKRCNKYDIMIDKYGDKTAGTVRFGLGGAYNVALAKIEVLEKNMQEYIRCYFESDTIFNYLHNACMASTRSSLNENNLDFLQLVIPNGKLLENFEKFAKKCIDKRLITTEENRKLMELRNFLLPMLMNGQVTVK